MRRYGSNMVMRCTYFLTVVWFLSVNSTHLFGAGKKQIQDTLADIPGNPPLLNAAMRDDIQAMQGFLQTGADVDMTNMHGQTGLMWASTYGATNVVKLLLEKGVDIDKRDASHGFAALVYATKSGNVDICRILIDSGANIETRDIRRQTPIIHAVHANKLDCLKLLIERKADLNAKDDKGMTALMWAALLQSPEIVSTLLASGADRSLVSNAGRIVDDYARRDVVKDVLKSVGGGNE